MKKRSVLLVMMLAVVMMLTACGNSLDGSWRATWDISEQMEESIYGSGMEDYMDCEGLTVDLIFTFDEEAEEIELEIDKDSVEAMMDTLKDKFIGAIDAYVEEYADMYGYTVDEFYEAMGMTRDEVIDMFVEQMDFDSLSDQLVDELKVEGEYKYDEEDSVIEVEFEDYEEFEMDCEFEDGKLILEFEFDGMDFELECEKEK